MAGFVLEGLLDLRRKRGGAGPGEGLFGQTCLSLRQRGAADARPIVRRRLHPEGLDALEVEHRIPLLFGPGSDRFESRTIPGGLEKLHGVGEPAGGEEAMTVFRQIGGGGFLNVKQGLFFSVVRNVSFHLVPTTRGRNSATLESP